MNNKMPSEYQELIVDNPRLMITGTGLFHRGLYSVAR